MSRDLCEALERFCVGGVAVDAKKLSEPERERLTRKFVQAFKVPQRARACAHAHAPQLMLISSEHVAARHHAANSEA